MKTGAVERGGTLPVSWATALARSRQCRDPAQKTMYRQRLMERQCHSFILPYAAFPPEPLLPPLSAILMPIHVTRAEAKKSRDMMPVRHLCPGVAEPQINASRQRLCVPGVRS